MYSLRRHFNGDVTEAQIVIKHLLFAHAPQAQSGRFEYARSLNGDGMKNATPVVKGNLAHANRHATNNRLSALPTGECERFGKAREQIYRPAMRAQFARNLQREFQFCQRLPNIRDGNGAEHGTAFIADNISLIPANDAVQAAPALRISKI